ncbi:MAG TPA: hypothetical protein VGQ80_00705 [Acidimicrobiia bacterium]|nr:hypothetical protein [Acidimicrobiia bacterium]
MNTELSELAGDADDITVERAAGPRRRRRWRPRLSPSFWHPAGICVASPPATPGAAAVAADLVPRFGLGRVLTNS